MRLSGTLSFEHKAKKTRRTEKDLNEKFQLIKILRKQFNLFGITGETIPIPGKIYHRMPDVVIPHKNIVIELDGHIHGCGDIISKRQEDVNRDKDYQKAGFKLIIINQEATSGYEINKVIEVLEREGLKKE